MARALASESIPGFDERLLFRFEVDKGFSPDELLKVSRDIEVVSQEGAEAVLAFVSSKALREFEARLTSLVEGGHVKYKNILYALKGVSEWGAGDRKGWALREFGFPTEEHFLLDIELWPLEDNPDERRELWQSFERWLEKEGIESKDSVKNDGLSLYRVMVTTEQAELLLRHRDVRTVDLPPRFGLDISLLRTDIQALPEIPPPPDGAPSIAVLDSGVVAGHPLLAPATGDLQSYLEGKSPIDENGHGTLVAGLALYGDLEGALQRGNLTPRLWLHSGRILDESNENNTGLIENQVTQAVEYFASEYGCRVFNLSYGDLNKPYLGGHVRGLAYTLDVLARKHNVLFVVSAGNVPGETLTGNEWLAEYPTCLTRDAWAILDPATSVNSIIVGSIARYDQTFSSQRYNFDPSEVPIARRDQPSPFTRHGPTVGGIVKPDFVEYGGNWAVNTRVHGGRLVESGLGELSTGTSFSTGRLFEIAAGTSMATPQVANMAAILLTEHKEASNDLVRALLGVSSYLPRGAEALVDQENIPKVYGYGKIDPTALVRSVEQEVTLIGTGAILDKRHHFYEVPIPTDFVTSGNRERLLSVALAHTPYVRSTRIAYKATRMSFRLVASDSLATVVTMFNRATTRDDYKAIPELANASPSSSLRDNGTLQVSRWRFRRIDARSNLINKRLFLVITRNDYPWAEAFTEAEEKYSIALAFRDPENSEARLYTDLRNRLRARPRARARA
jgi:hypothetical protein